VFLTSPDTSPVHVIAYSVNRARYLGEQGFDAEQETARHITTRAVDGLPVQVVDLPAECFAVSDSIMVSLVGPNGTVDYAVVTVGHGLPTPTNLLVVYGRLLDIQQRPLTQQVVEFSAQFSDGNPFRTPMRAGSSAYVVTDHDGRFYVQLSREQDYLVVAPGLGLSQTLRASRVPVTQSSLELQLHRGWAQE
jgi:hypothetical protein